jgi:hypothetical protein
MREEDEMGKRIAQKEEKNGKDEEKNRKMKRDRREAEEERFNADMAAALKSQRREK